MRSPSVWDKRGHSFVARSGLCVATIMSCDDFGLSLNSKACVRGPVSGNADVQVALDSGTVSVVLGLDSPSSRVACRDALCACARILCRLRGLALSFRSGQPCCRRVACRDDGLCRAFRVLCGLAALPIYAVLSGGYVTLAAMLFWAAL